MIKNYLITAIRNISRNLGYSLINFIGLSFGIALFILIILYVRNEYSYDKFNTNIERIYRFEFGDAENVHLPSAAGLDAQDWFPDIEKVVRFRLWGSQTFQYETTSFRIPNVMIADSSFFDVFTTEFVNGDPKTAFEVANSIVLTEKNAKNIFGDIDPINQILKINEHEFVVTGVIKEFPNFHIQTGALIPFNILAYMNDLNKVDREFLRSYGTWQFPTYFLISGSVDTKNLAKKLVGKFLERWPDWENPLITLRPLKDVYFADHSKEGFQHGNKNTVKLFFAIGIFIIFIACINFINLTTAKASNRATEVGIRKVHGGFKRQLVFQFLSESILITFISFLIAITLVQALLPFFNNLIQKELYFLTVFNLNFVLISIIGILFIGFIAGIYPAFYLTAFNPIKVLKGEKTKGKSAAIFRRILIVIQFTISVALIISTITVQKQINYLREKDMGFSKENTIAIGLNSKLKENKEAFKQALLNYPEIESISFSAGIIGSMGNTESFDFNSDGERTSIQLHSIDPEFIEQFEIEIIEGRNFSFDNTTDTKQKIILNEEAVKAGGLKLGETAETIFHRDSWYFTALPSKDCEVIGVVKSFNFRSLHEAIGPQGLVWNEDWHYNINIKIQEGTTTQALEIVETVFKEFSGDIPFEYRFIDDHIDNLYKSDKRLGKFFTYFSIIAIIIAMLGLLGLAAYIAESRTKEIGIRKALGSSVSKIIFMISKEFIKWVLIANIIAIPIATYGMNKWLQTFAYKIKITPDIYILAAILSIFIALITVFYQSFKASRSKPADSLRYE
ncbi:MAG: FtsX-like permease family protein [Bacteroidales bacterium]|nr:FtsX-like permease family protein [Bacteroidales bacterium]